MTLNKLIKILEHIKEQEGGEIEVIRTVIGKKIEPRPRVRQDSKKKYLYVN